MQVDGREITVSGSLLQPPTRRTNDILRVALSAVFLAAVITSSVVTRTRWDQLEKSISRIVGVLTPTQSDVVYLVYGLAILALPFMILIGLILSRQWKLLGPYAAAAFIAFLALSVTGKGLAKPAPMALRPVRPGPHGVRAIPRRPALDRDARRGAHRVGPVAARAMAALVVDAAAGVRADSPRGQRRRAGPLTAGPGGGVVRRRAGGPGQRHSRARSAAGRRGPRADQTRIRGVRTHGGPPSRNRAAHAFCGIRGCKWDRDDRVVLARIKAAAARCASCGASCGCAAARPHPFRRPCAAPSSIAR